MSVFTPLTRPELETFLAPYGLGRLRDFQGIAAGTENSNFFVSLEQGEFVLTLVERGPIQDLPFFIELLDVLHEADLPVPYALRTTDGVAALCAGRQLIISAVTASNTLAVAEAVAPPLPRAGVAFNTQSKAEFVANWDRQVGCPDQFEPAVREAVCEGAGLSVLPDYVIADDLAAGRAVAAVALGQYGIGDPRPHRLSP